MTKKKSQNIGFVSTRFAGTDGVSLETAKWTRLLAEMGYECFFFAGESDLPEERTYLVDEAHFNHPQIRELNKDLFDDYQRSSETSGEIQGLRFFLKRKLYDFIGRFDIQLLIVENAWAIPMNIPLGLALTELVAETNLPAIGHHHDFAWERKRFKVTSAADYLWGAFPPILPSVHHVVINSFAARQLALRTGISATLVPNVMDFDTPPPEPDDYADDFREAFSIDPNEFILLQPTRIVPRKQIERAVELTRRLETPCVLIISHALGDEGSDYHTYLKEYAELLGVRVIMGAEQVSYHRGTTPDGRKIYSLMDTYRKADLVTYPSTVEGFGNAFLEAIYYQRPIVMSTYEIYRRDIQPKGFRVIEFDEFISDETISQVRDILHYPTLTERLTARNYALGRRYYSYRVLRNHLTTLLQASLGV